MWIQRKALAMTSFLVRALRALVNVCFFMWLQQDSNPQTSQVIELCCAYLYERCIWLHVLIMSCTRFRVNLHSVAALMSRNSLFETGAISELQISLDSEIFQRICKDFKVHTWFTFQCYWNFYSMLREVFIAESPTVVIWKEIPSKVI